MEPEETPTCQELQRRLAETEARAERLKMIVRAVRRVSQLIVSEEDAHKLIDGAVERLMESGAYDTVWIALLGDLGNFKALAARGFETEIHELQDQIESGDLPPCVRRALDQREASQAPDPETGCAECPIHQ